MSKLNNTLRSNPVKNSLDDAIFTFLVGCVIALVIATLYVLWEVVSCKI